MSDATRPIPAPQASPGAEPTAADLTAPIPVRRGPGRHQRWLALIAIGAASFLAGILLGTTTRPTDGAAVIAEADVPPQGRTLRFEGGLMVFPEGAVDRTTHVVVRAEPLRGKLRVEDAGTAIIVESGELRAYRFEPADLTFAEPVEITFRLPSETRRAAIFARRDGRTLLLDGSIDHVRRTATVRVDDLTFRGR